MLTRISITPSRFLAMLILALIVSIAPAHAQTKPKILALPESNPASAIFIGNSFFYYNNGIVAHIRGMMEAETSPRRFRSTMATIGGAGFDWHDVESYFRPGAIGRYSFDRNNNVVMNDPKQKLFDVAILMDCSVCSVHPDLKGVFTDYAKKHTDTVRRHGAVPVLFMSWAFQDKPEMITALAEAYTKAGNDNDTLVIPAGLAFARALAERPGLSLHAKDKRHPSLAGSILAAATTYATLFGRSPVGLTYDTEISAEEITFLQTVAWATTQAYFKP